MSENQPNKQPQPPKNTTPEDPNEPDLTNPQVQLAIDRYWRKNVRLMTILLIIWAAVGLGCGVLFADALNAFRIGGFPLGFWFAQQGSIAVFVVLIFVYALQLNRLDAQHHDELQRIRNKGDA